MALTALLLFTARHAIVRGPTTTLSRAVRFLHAEYSPGCFAWELMEMGRRFLLVGVFVVFMQVSHVAYLIEGMFEHDTRTGYIMTD